MKEQEPKIVVVNSETPDEGAPPAEAAADAPTEAGDDAQSEEGKSVNEAEKGDVVKADVDDEEASQESVESPAKVMRIGTMIKQLLEEVREAPLDERSRSRLREIYETSVKELAEGVSPDLRDELDRLVSPFEGEAIPSESELRIAQAQLVGWLEGLFHGIHATVFAQQVAARNQIEQMARKSLPPRAGQPGSDSSDDRLGTYL